MAFEEKSTLTVTAVFVAVYGWYFTRVLTRASTEPVDQIDYQGLLAAMVIVLVVLAVIAHVAIAAAAPGEAGASDERDRAVAFRSDRVEVYVLSVGGLMGLGLAMAEVAHFWIAHLLLGMLVLSEITGGVTKLILYRRGV